MTITLKNCKKFSVRSIWCHSSWQTLLDFIGFSLKSIILECILDFCIKLVFLFTFPRIIEEETKIENYQGSDTPKVLWSIVQYFTIHMASIVSIVQYSQYFWSVWPLRIIINLKKTPIKHDGWIIYTSMEIILEFFKNY